jgi:hypothetical protein
MAMVIERSLRETPNDEHRERSSSLPRKKRSLGRRPPMCPAGDPMPTTDERGNRTTGEPR